MSKLLAAAIAVCAAATFGSVAAAETAPTRSISVASVDMSDSAAVNSLYARIKGAARAVCDSHSPIQAVAAKDAACYDRQVASAVRQINQPALNAVYNRSSNRMAMN